MKQLGKLFYRIQDELDKSFLLELLSNENDRTKEPLINVSLAKIFEKQYNRGKQSKAGVRYERSDNIDGC